jgi:hypothetical protein
MSRILLQTSGGTITWKVPTGRRDGLVSLASEVHLPSPTSTVATLTSDFAAVGLSVAQMVALSGTNVLILIINRMQSIYSSWKFVMLSSRLQIFPAS